MFQVWNYTFKHHVSDFHFFVKVDQDTYVNYRNVDSLLSALLPYSASVQYIGKPFYGRLAEAKALGLNGKSYCSGKCRGGGAGGEEGECGGSLGEPTTQDE